MKPLSPMQVALIKAAVKARPSSYVVVMVRTAAQTRQKSNSLNKERSK